VTPTNVHRGAMVLLLVIIAVGALDAASGRVWDHFVVFVLAGIVQGLLLLTLAGGRPAVPLRSDLVSWLRQRAARTGEPMELIADRCIASARADLEYD
jgi:hypothetical protein